MTTLAPPPTTLDTIGDELCSLAGQIAAATGRFLALLADFDTREGWGGAGVRSCAHWLAWRCGMDLRTAREHVRVARALIGLPRTTAELAEGRLSYSKVRALARVATPDTEDDLVDIALAAPATHVERLVRGLRTVADRDADEAMSDAERAEQTAHRCRTQWRWDDETGELVIWGRLRPQDGAVLLAALTRAEHERTRTAAHDAGSEDGPAGPPSPPDLTGGPPSDAGPALVAMATMTCAAVDAPRSAVAAEVLVHRTADGAHLEGGPHLPYDAAEELVCGATRRDVGLQDGCVLSYGRARRTPSTTQLRALHLRDRGCRAPGCERTRFLHAHHVRPWSRGGVTDLDNLVLLCGSCHRSLHLHEFSVEADGRQQFTFQRQDAPGRSRRRRPGPRTTCSATTSTPPRSSRAGAGNRSTSATPRTCCGEAGARRHERGAGARRHFLGLSPASELSAATKASCGTSTRPTVFIRFLPSFCFSSSLRLRLMSPP